MKILGVETSCDETGVCLIEAAGIPGASFRFQVLGDGLASQAALHAQYGGVFPNLAKREHSRMLVPLLQQVLSDAGQLRESTSAISGATFVPLKEMLARESELAQTLLAFALRYERPDIDAIAVTYGPGLEPTLWVGINFAKALSTIWNIPIVAVNHMEGHIVMPMVDLNNLNTSNPYSNVLKNIGVGGRFREFEFPVLSLLISGGHTELVLSKEFGEYERIGETRDDAAGEAFDKVARLLGLSYPGGPEISKLAADARQEGIIDDIKLTPPMLRSNDYDFSFSGLKTEVRKLVEKNKSLSEEMKKKIALATEVAITEVLVAKTLRAVEEYGAATVILGGGVSANAHIRLRLAEALAQAGVKLLVCPPELATDNALMIALAGYFHAIKKEFVDSQHLTANGNLKLS